LGEVFANASADAPPAVYFAKTSPNHPISPDQSEYHGVNCLSKCHWGQTCICFLTGVIPMFFFVAGVILLTLIISLFWLKDQLQNPLLARVVYSGLVARLAVVGAAFVALGLLLMLADFAKYLSA